MPRWCLIPTVVLASSVAVSAASAQVLLPPAAPPYDEGSNTSQGADREDARDAGRRADVRGAIEDSLRLLFIEHAVRIGTQEKTRQGLKGPFFSDYKRSVVMPSQWGDGDSWYTNYVGHPGQGAASGFIWLQNSSESEVPFAFTREYLASRLRAMAWATGYSVQFEIGPLSEASIGNVGMNRKTAGWVDYVATPAGGLGIMIGEDLLDRFVVQPLEARTDSRIVRAMARMFLNPSRATANVAGLRAPWYRIGRPLSD
jgi:hypothetical protein